MSHNSQKFNWKLTLTFVSGLCFVLGLMLTFGGIFDSAEASLHTVHQITITTKELSTGELAYQMVSHVIQPPVGPAIDVTLDRYGPILVPQIPGPTIIMTEGDMAEITLMNEIGRDCVSMHVHGVYYPLEDDGTLKVTNGVADSCATVSQPWVYNWSAADAGTVGTWPWHDHTFESPNGAEDKGLYAALIVNPADGLIPAFIAGQQVMVDVNDIEKEFVLYMFQAKGNDPEFNGEEIDNGNGGLHTPLGDNPFVDAMLGDKVRFHILGMGNFFHTFHLHATRWLEPGTTDVIDTKNIGPLTRHAFVIEAGQGVGPGDWMYHCHVFSHMELGMTSIFRVHTSENTITVDTPGDIVVAAGEKLVIKNGATIDGNIVVNGGTLFVIDGSVVTGLVNANEFAAVTIEDSTIGLLVTGNKAADISIERSTINKNINLFNNQVVRVTDNIVGRNLNIVGTTGECTNFGNTVSGIFNACP